MKTHALKRFRVKLADNEPVYVAEQILQLKDSIRAAGKHCGVMTTSIDNLLQRREQYFINESEHQVDMIWVYTGPLPERIVIAPGFVREPVA